MAISGRMCASLLRGLFVVRTPYVIDPVSQRCPWRPMSVTAADTNDGKKTEDKSPLEEDVAAMAEELWKQEKLKLTDDISNLQDKYKRSLAETENVRQRMKKQIDDTKLFGIQGFCKDLLEVADILEKANESVPREELKTSSSLNNLFEGLAMTESQLHKVFTRNGLSQINPAQGEKFDPNIHEALFQAPSTEGSKPDTVATVTKLGYRLHSRTLRPALVGVYKDA